MSVDQVTMNTHSSSVKAVRIALADPQQRERRQQRIDEARRDTRRRPSRARSASIRRTSRSRPRRRARRSTFPPTTAATSASDDQASGPVSGADEKLAHRPAEAALARGEIARAPRRKSLVEIGPERVDEHQFGIGRLPQQEIRQPHFARGADQQIESAASPRVCSSLRSRPRRSRPDRSRPLRLGRQLPCGGRHFRPRTVIERDDERQPIVPAVRSTARSSRATRSGRRPNNRRSAAAARLSFSSVVSSRSR